MTPIDVEEILREIRKTTLTKEWMRDLLDKKTNYRDIQEGRQGLELLNSYISGLEFALNLTKKEIER